MLLALCQINTTVGDIAGNAKRIESAYASAVSQGADLVAFPELALSGYPPRDLLEQRDFVAGIAREVRRLASISGEAGLLFGTPLPNSEPHGKALSNGAVLCSRGEVAAEIRKKLLPTYDVFDEARHFQADVSEAKPVLFNGIQWGVHLCEDAWNEDDFWDHRLYRRDPVEELAGNGAQVLLNLSASPFRDRKSDLRRNMLASHSQSLGLPMLYLNLVGANDELIFDGESLVIDAQGRTLHRSLAFEEDLLWVSVEPGGAVEPKAKTLKTSFLERTHSVRCALRLGIQDYAKKCGFDSVVLGVSGGIDSAVTAALAADALGGDALWCVAMPSRYSSSHSLEDAEALAKNLGARYDVISIDDMFQTSLDTLAPAFEGSRPGVAEENLQARARGTVLMGLSNKFGHLLLTTGNKSELATGYCTLYGDMAGGLAVLSDVPKTLVYDLANHINMGPNKVPQNTIDKPPSAELRPDQTDQDSLPPYSVLDDILEGFIEEGKSMSQLVQQGHDAKLVQRVLQMVARAEYKRRQAPPGLRISPKAFGMGRRVPIATPWPLF